jgi:hypothetical protein
MPTLGPAVETWFSGVPNNTYAAGGKAVAFDACSQSPRLRTVWRGRRRAEAQRDSSVARSVRLAPSGPPSQSEALKEDHGPSHCKWAVFRGFTKNRCASAQCRQFCRHSSSEWAGFLDAGGAGRHLGVGFSIDRHLALAGEGGQGEIGGEGRFPTCAQVAIGLPILAGGC